MATTLDMAHLPEDREVSQTQHAPCASNNRQLTRNYALERRLVVTSGEQNLHTAQEDA